MRRNNEDKIEQDSLWHIFHFFFNIPFRGYKAWKSSCQHNFGVGIWERIHWQEYLYLFSVYIDNNAKKFKIIWKDKSYILNMQDKTTHSLVILLIEHGMFHWFWHDPPLVRVKDLILFLVVSRLEVNLQINPLRIYLTLHEEAILGNLIVIIKTINLSSIFMRI